MSILYQTLKYKAALTLEELGGKKIMFQEKNNFFW